MEIIKQGKDVNHIMYKFICTECECEFRAGKEEVTDGICKCPNCGEDCFGQKED